MKQKTNIKTPVTKEELTDILKDYPTKDDLSERLLTSQNAFRTEIDHKLDTMKEEILTGMSTFTNMVLTAIDPLIKDMQIRQQEREVVTGQIRRVENDVDRLKKRVTKLEHS